MSEPLNIVITGELDSGKSTLIGRLLYDTHSISKSAIEEVKRISQDLQKDIEFAYLLDSFEEERKEEFTLDTTQAFLKTRNRGYLFIDIPGHKELLKNMLTGASFADTAVLVVDIQKGLEEQTCRHAYILKFLGIDKIIVLINKIDLVSYDEEIFEKLKEQINEFFKKLELKPVYIVPVSAKNGDNLLSRSSMLSWFQGPSVIEALDNCFKKEKTYDFRFPIQDIYKIKDECIAVGTIISGKIKKNEIVKVMPEEKDCEIKSIKVFDGCRDRAESGESIGLVLKGIENLSRGSVICKGTLPKPTNQIKAKIFCLDFLDIQEDLIFRCSTQEAKSRITQISESIDTQTLEAHKEQKRLNQTEAASVTIGLDKPVVVERFQDLDNLGRFILFRDNKICAIGIIL